MATPSFDTEPTTHDIANRLVVQLLLIGILSLIASAVAFTIASPFGLLAYVAVAIVNVPVLWLVVHAGFDAFEDVLQANLECDADVDTT
ncbi:hypothetical protein OB905_11250 [Halobacteria archaeon AArc-dxtr1]|nr:hypothetical protein [Halobacteria archaeon AArc-dxtr1]